jgi:cobalt-zinc-cadmium efflux system outer membrane protein
MAGLRTCSRTFLITGMLALFAAAGLSANITGAAEAAQNTIADTAERLDALIVEGLRNSPYLAQLRSEWLAQRQTIPQVSTLPDPEITFQSFSVGSPVPGHGLQTNPFAYLGWGASQEIPFPGKLGLNAKIARADEKYLEQELRAGENAVGQKISQLYYELSYQGSEHAILLAKREELRRIAQITAARYRVGEADQQDVLKAQLQMSAILKELVDNEKATEQSQAELKAVLGRQVDSPPIRVGGLRSTELKLQPAELQARAERDSPEINAQRVLEERASRKMARARKDFFPDFDLGYMYQSTGPPFPNYYVATISAKVPLYFWRKQEPALKQASLELEAARARMRATELTTYSSLGVQEAARNAAARLMTVYKQALLPQAQATYESAMASYRVGKVDFQTLLAAFNDVLELQRSYYRALADHEIANSKIKQLIGEFRSP